MINASDLSRDLFNWIQDKENKGEIHSIFKNTINILSEDGRFIPIYTNDKPMSSNAIRLKEKIVFKDLNLSIGEEGIFTKESFSSKNLNINYIDSKIWDNRIKLNFTIDTYDNVLEKLELVKKFILIEGNKDGIFPLMQFLPGNLFVLSTVKIEDKGQLFIKEKFVEFLVKFKCNEEEHINLSSRKIIGFGPGLTPSMDDFLSGIMIANLYTSYFLDLEIYLPYKLNRQIVDNIDNLTTRVSLEMLKASSVGESNQDIRDLMVSIFGKSKGFKIEDIMSKVIDFGYSSGTDILCGIYVGILIKLNNQNKSTKHRLK